MRNKKIIKKSYENVVQDAPSFEKIKDKLDLNNQTKKRRLPLWGKITLIASICATIIMAIIPAAIVLLSGIHETNKFSANKINYGINDVNLIKSETFKKLNNITRDSTYKEKIDISEESLSSINSFNNVFYNLMNKENNFIVSPFSLYAQLDAISLAVSDSNINQKIDDVLFLNDRETFIKNTMENNFYYNETKNLKSTIQLKEAIFSTNNYGGINNEFIDKLTNRRIEAYQADFLNNNDVNKILDWIQDSIKERNFLNKNDLELDNDSLLLFLTSLYFKSSWDYSYLSTKTTNDTFYLDSDEEIIVPFMHHSYYGKVYDYNSYLSFYDYYAFGNSIQYIVPKKIENKIKNIDISEALLNENSDLTNSDGYIISLSLPKFEATSYLDLKEPLIKMGLEDLYNEEKNIFNDVFNNKEAITKSYLKYTKQKTSIEFSEDGTMSKSITFSLGAGNASQGDYYNNGYNINLNQSFVYIIRDRNDVPILLGYVNNPSHE